MTGRPPGSESSSTRRPSDRLPRLVALGLVSALVTCQALLAVHHRALPAPEFTARAWASATPEWRGLMLPSLRRQHDLTGRPRAEVIALLGPPDRSEATSLVYELGTLGHPLRVQQRSHVLGSCRLRVLLRDGRVTDHYVAD